LTHWAKILAVTDGLSFDHSLEMRKQKMKSRIFLFGFFSLPIVGLVLGILLGISPVSHDEASRPIIGNVRTFEAAYTRWKADAERNDQKNKLVLSLGYFRGLSSEFSKAQGRAVLDLANGSLAVEVAGLPERRAFAVWLVHNRPGPGRSVKPEPGDRMIRAGALMRDGDNARLETSLDRESLAGFKLDLIVVVPDGRSPTDSGLLYASPNVFQKLYYSEAPAGNLVSTRLSDPDDAKSRASLLLAPFRSLVPTLAYAAGGGNPHLADLVARGEKLFFEEKFRGNGRTCGTCHPADNNFTIDPAYIATLPKNDPLFVAEFKRELNSDKNGGRGFFEVPLLMRQSGLILENVDGFDDLTSKFVLRGVPHLLALQFSITPATTFTDGTSTDVARDRTGWGGDGAPGTGTLREFAIGAVFQHFTQSLDRIPGVDFRLPTDAELDAIEAFLLSLGRPSELDLSTLVLIDDNASDGLTLFNNDVGKCSLCHFNAGANQSLSNSLGTTENANFNTGVEDLVGTHPILPSGLVLPRDGGFGQGANPDGSGSFGNGTFNTPSLVEAANTAPFFHNNSVNTIEQAVGFYNSVDRSAFGESPANDLVGGISLNTTQVNQIAAFLRVINSLETIRSAGTRLTSALEAKHPPRADKLIELAIVNVKDAIRVLTESPLSLHLDARTKLGNALAFCDTARKTGNKSKRDASINAALSALGLARGDMVDER
jgi:cytochrome c peroxidase